MSPKLPSAQVLARLEAGRQLMRARRPIDALAALDALLADQPRLAEAHYLRGMALWTMGDKSGAEQALRRAVSADQGHRPAAVALSELRLADTDAAGALAAVEALAAAQDADLNLLTAHGDALKALERFDEAIASYERGVRAMPTSAVAEHNLAGALGDAQRHAEAEAVVARAFAKGLDAPETWMVKGRAIQGQDRLEEAELAYREALRRRPDYAEALGELAQSIWMRTEDLAAARAPLDQAIAAFPQSLHLRIRRARLLDFAGDNDGAYRTLLEGIANGQTAAAIHVVAAQISAQRDADLSLRHAQNAFDQVPNDPLSLTTLCEAYLAVGEPAKAAPLARSLRERDPLDQRAIALQATAWRMLGDPRYGELYDYDRLVRAWTLEAPPGWSSLADYLSDLTTALTRLHGARAHPIGQSLRGGTQTQQSLTASSDPVVRALFQALDEPIRAHIAAIAGGKDPTSVRAQGDYRFQGAWSVRLRGGGFHTNHLHQKGWLSSALYVALPQAIEQGQAGWIRFGEPGVPTRPALAPEHVVKPEPGKLVLFPSHMWHGTAPFQGDETRLTVAFDLLPR